MPFRSSGSAGTLPAARERDKTQSGSAHSAFGLKTDAYPMAMAGRK
jgi:hypothetical protein